jgi:hypothetical protein
MANSTTPHSRREFLGRSVAGAIIAGAALAGTDALALAARPKQAPATRTITPSATSSPAGPVSAFAIEIDQAIAVFPISLEGGNFTADVVAAAAGTDGVSHKHLADVRPEEISITFGTAVSRNLLDWIKSSLERHPVAKNGAIVFLGNDRRPVSRVEWLNAQISEVTFPACSASAKDNSFITLKILPEQIRTAPASLSSTSGVLPARPWQSSNFMLQIPGCDNSCKYASSIEALTVKFSSSGSGTGQVREYTKSSGSMSVADLSVVLDFARSDDFQQWQKSFEIQGQASLEKSGTLQYLGSDLKSTLLTLNFSGLGIYKLSPITGSAFEKVKAQMFCDSIDLTYR